PLLTSSTNSFVAAPVVPVMSSLTRTCTSPPPPPPPPDVMQVRIALPAASYATWTSPAPLGALHETPFRSSTESSPPPDGPGGSWGPGGPTGPVGPVSPFDPAGPCGPLDVPREVELVREAVGGVVDDADDADRHVTAGLDRAASGHRRAGVCHGAY